MLKNLNAITADEFDEKIMLSMNELEEAINSMQNRLHEYEMKQEFSHKLPAIYYRTNYQDTEVIISRFVT